MCALRVIGLTVGDPPPPPAAAFFPDSGLLAAIDTSTLLATGAIAAAAFVAGLLIASRRRRAEISPASPPPPTPPPATPPLASPPTPSPARDVELRSLLDNTPVAMALLRGDDGAILHLNQNFLETFGYSHAEVPNLDAWWLRAYPDPDYRREVHDNWCGRLLNTPADKSLPPHKSRVTCRDGGLRTIEWHGTRVGSHVVVLGVDLTSHLQSDAALRTSEQRYRVLLDSAAEAVVVFDLDKGHFIDCNPAAERLFKLPREELFRCGPAELSPARQPDGRASAEFALELLQRTVAGEIPTFEWIHFDSDRREIPCEIRLLLMPDPGGRRLIRGTIVDISARKRSADTLRENEERFRLLIENSTELVAQIDLTATIVYASPNHVAITGYTAEEMVGRNVFEFIHPEDGGRVREAFESRNEQATRVFRYRFKDGSWHWLESAGRRFRTSSGNEMAAVISRDITDRVTSEEERKRLENQVRQGQKMEAIGTLAGGIAHDFNNILTGLFGNLQLAEEQLPPDHPVRPMLTGCFRACVRARDLVAKILTFSQRREQQRETVPLGTLVREIVGLLRPSLPATIEIRTEIPERELLVHCDPVQIHQVLMNLGTNAAHAMRDRGGVLTFALNLTEADPAVIATQPSLEQRRVARISVIDTGTGMDAATRERIFEPFFTTKPLGEGTGLGLAVVHGIIENHHGAITVESTLNVGTRFHVWLPTPELAPPPSPRAPSRSPFESALPRGKGESILFVDDEAAVCEVGARILRNLGYKVAAFLRASEAIAAFHVRPDDYDIVISDLTMPEITGTDIAREVRLLRPDIPIIITTGYMRTVEVDRARALGVQEFVEKPFTLEQLADTIRRTLDAG